ncbi:hypothetical protein VSU19_07795 [Verrucomicrobiales bacterium BCK34]|nr:hypothetical protein [Verrucomicrobiales bacterium BCK34]
MKSTIAIFLMLCLQVAISPLCLCFVADATQESAKPSCCHFPQEEDPTPCPHCDQEMPIAATAPEKIHFSTNPPEWHGLDLFTGIDIFDALYASTVESPENAVVRDFEPPPLDFCERFGVFRI